MAALTLGGCEYLYGKPKDGGSTPAEVIQTVASSFGPIGQLISLAVGGCGLLYGGHRHVKHHRVVKENHALRAKLPSSVKPGDIPPTPPA